MIEYTSSIISLVEYNYFLYMHMFVRVYTYVIIMYRYM